MAYAGALSKKKLTPSALRRHAGPSGAGRPKPGGWRGSGTKRRTAGFTLIEVLVSTLILTMVVFTATFSFSFFLRVWENNKFRNVRALSEYRDHTLVRRALASGFDYYVTDPQNEKKGIHYPFFDGDADQFTMVVRASVFNYDQPAAVRVSFQNNERTGLKDLVYEEFSLTDDYIRYDDQVIKYDKHLTLYTDIAAHTIRYLGPSPDREHAAGLEDIAYNFTWFEKFTGKKLHVLPRWIEITMETDGIERKILYRLRCHRIAREIIFNPLM